jgi:hypothetical protein
MSSFVEEDRDGGLAEELETLEDIKTRHKREVRELETKIRFLLKQPKKSKKSEVDSEVCLRQ